MKADRASSLFWLVICLLAACWSLKLGFGTLQEPGPGFFPFLSSGFVSLLAAIVLLQSILNKESLQTKVRALWERVNWKRPVVVCLLVVGYILILETAGFFITGFLLIFIILKVIERLSWTKSIVVPVLALVSVFIIFEILLKTHLPKGIFGF